MKNNESLTFLLPRNMPYLVLKRLAPILTILILFIMHSSIAQIGNKLPMKDIKSTISVNPDNAQLSDVGLPRNFNIKKISRFKVPREKLNLPSRNKVKITPLKPYSSNLELSFQGRYNKHYFLLGNIHSASLGDGGIITFNAQKGKEYRMKVSLTDKKNLLAHLRTDFPNGDVVIKIGRQGTYYSIPVNQNNREFSIVFSAAKAGKINFILHGIMSSNYECCKPLWLPIKSIEVDEI